MTEQDENAGEQRKAQSGDDKPAAENGAAEQSPGDAFKKGVSLLWQAARAAADEITREVKKGGVRESLQQAGHDLEVAAQHAAKALEDFIERAGPKAPSPDYTDKWPPDDKDKEDDASSEAKQADADIPPDGGKTEDGERRDMRIQVDDEE